MNEIFAQAVLEEIRDHPTFLWIQDYHSSLHDGMNLVAKEYVAAKSELNGVLILSCFTGASRELTDALSINPYDLKGFSDALKAALEMPIAQRRKRMAKLREVVSEHNIYRWAGEMINALSRVPGSPPA